MGKVFGILVIVAGVWVGLTVFTEGSDNAFGGLFAGAGSEREREIAGASGQPVMERVEAQVNDAYRENEERIERQVGE